MKRALVFAAGGLFAAVLIAAVFAWHTYRSSKPLAYAGADAPSSGPPANKAPHLALVLSSGGGRGYAHVGVLKVLAEAGIKPDLVVGTSVGALIGALYAAGLAPAEIEKRALDFDYSALQDYTLSRYGQLKGEGLVRFVNEALGARPIEALQLRLAIIVSDLTTGRTAVFTRGNTGVAVRASAASVGRIVPLRIGDAVYADGDLTSPLAVRAARRLGARRVIAVDVSADPAVAPFDEIPIEWTAEAVTRRALIDAEAPDADIVVRPRLPYYVPHTRAYKEMAMRRGEEAAREALPRLKAVAGAGPFDAAQDRP